MVKNTTFHINGRKTDIKVSFIQTLFFRHISVSTTIKAECKLPESLIIDIKNMNRRK